MLEHESDITQIPCSQSILSIIERKLNYKVCKLLLLTASYKRVWRNLKSAIGIVIKVVPVSRIHVYGELLLIIE